MFEIWALAAIYQALVGTVWHHGKVCHSKMKNAHFQIKDSLYFRTAIWKHFVHGDSEIFGCFEIITLFWFFVCWLRQVWVASSRITKLTQEFDEGAGGDGGCGRNEMPFLQRTFEYLSTSTEHSSNNWKIVATRERSQSLLPIPPSWAILQIFGCASSAINSLWEQHQKMQFFTIWRRSAFRINFAILLALAPFFGIWGFWNKQVELLPLQREQCFPKSNYVSS